MFKNMTHFEKQMSKFICEIHYFSMSEIKCQFLNNVLKFLIPLKQAYIKIKMVLSFTLRKTYHINSKKLHKIATI